MNGDVWRYFHAKVNKLLGDIEGVKAYIDNILILNKGTFAEHREQLRICFSCILKAGFKTNANKCSFGLKEIPYLGYVITRGGIKKNQGIMYLQRPKTTTNCINLIDMVQYYWETRRNYSQILATTTEASIGKKGKKKEQTKYIKMAV